MNRYQQETLPSISLNMAHRLILSQKQKEHLLEERQNIISRSIQEIQLNFFRIGKALAEIKKFKLYKNDFCSSWTEYIHNHVKPNLHQSTISDYIGIVKMQIENQDFVHETDIIRLGYKKAKLIRSKMNLIEKEKDLSLRSQLKRRLKEFYLKSIDKEFRDLPYTTYEQALLAYIQISPNSTLTQSSHITSQENQYFKIHWNKKHNKLSITAQKGQEEYLEKLYHLVLKINGFR